MTDEHRSDPTDPLATTFGAAIMARLIGCSPWTVRQHASALGGVRVGGRWVFALAALRERVGDSIVDGFVRRFRAGVEKAG
jgi:hypothetical protein